eukprot:Colp12_sorted_trinity150504_noHs@15578
MGQRASIAYVPVTRAVTLEKIKVVGDQQVVASVGFKEVKDYNAVDKGSFLVAKLDSRTQFKLCPKLKISKDIKEPRWITVWTDGMMCHEQPIPFNGFLPKFGPECEVTTSNIVLSSHTERGFAYCFSLPPLPVEEFSATGMTTVWFYIIDSARVVHSYHAIYVQRTEPDPTGAASVRLKKLGLFRLDSTEIPVETIPQENSEIVEEELEGRQSSDSILQDFRSHIQIKGGIPYSDESSSPETDRPRSNSDPPQPPNNVIHGILKPYSPTSLSLDSLNSTEVSPRERSRQIPRSIEGLRVRFFDDVPHSPKKAHKAATSTHVYTVTNRDQSTQTDEQTRDDKRYMMLALYVFVLCISCMVYLYNENKRLKSELEASIVDTVSCVET